jgi:hypothetical protein
MIDQEDNIGDYEESYGLPSFPEGDSDDYNGSDDFEDDDDDDDDEDEEDDDEEDDDGD